MRIPVVVLLLLFVFIEVQAWSKDEIAVWIDEKPHDTTIVSSVYIAVFGDIQYLTNETYSNIYAHSLDWIEAKKKEGWSFNCILQTGDITNSNAISQWNQFYQATVSITQQIPFFSMIGDHDYSWDEFGHIENRLTTHFNEYVQFPLSTAKIVAWFEEGRMENIVVKNTIHGQRFDFLILEFGPREEVMDWAETYVKMHPDHRFILMTHEYLEKRGNRRVKGLKMVSRLRNTTYTTPEQIWNNLVKCNDNIRIVLCGHVGSLYSITIEKNDFGREIPQIQHNVQSLDYRYDNWLMLWEFPVENDSARVFVYNTNTELYYNNQETLFKFKYLD